MKALTVMQGIFEVETVRTSSTGMTWPSTDSNSGAQHKVITPMKKIDSDLNNSAPAMLPNDPAPNSVTKIQMRNILIAQVIRPTVIESLMSDLDGVNRVF